MTKTCRRASLAKDRPTIYSIFLQLSSRAVETCVWHVSRERDRPSNKAYKRRMVLVSPTGNYHGCVPLAVLGADQLAAQ